MTLAQARRGGSAVRQARWAGLLLIAIGSFHLAVFLVQAAWLGHLDGWVRGELRSMSTLDMHMSQAQAAFWLTVGSFAVPVTLLGVVIVRLARARLVVPGCVVWGLGIWVLAGSVILEPSGFPLGLIPVGLLRFARRGSTGSGVRDGR